MQVGVAVVLGVKPEPLLTLLGWGVKNKQLGAGKLNKETHLEVAKQKHHGILSTAEDFAMEEFHPEEKKSGKFLSLLSNNRKKLRNVEW